MRVIVLLLINNGERGGTVEFPVALLKLQRRSVHRVGLGKRTLVCMGQMGDITWDISQKSNVDTYFRLPWGRVRWMLLL